MVVNQKVTGRAMGMPAGVAIGGGIAYAATMILCSIMAWLLYSERFAIENIGYASMITLLLSSALGAFVSQGIVKHRKMISCLATGGVYFAMLLGTTALFLGGQYQGIGVTFGIVLAGVGSVGLIVTKKKKTITKGYRIPRTG